MDQEKVSKATTAEEARQYAIEWQAWQSGRAMSYGELIEWQDVFKKLAQRFPELLEEFKENGIL